MARSDKPLDLDFLMIGSPRQNTGSRSVTDNGNIFVVEWVVTGRVTKLRKLS